MIFGSHPFLQFYVLSTNKASPFTERSQAKMTLYIPRIVGKLEVSQAVLYKL